MINCKPATKNDVPLIQELAKAIWRAHYADIISITQIDYMLDLMYSEQSLIRQMQEGQPFTLIYSHHEPIGYYSISEKEPGQFFLHKFYIQTAAQRKGNGTAAFKYLLSGLSEGSLRLQVNRRNFKAINFYFKHGFTIEYAFDFDIGGGYSMDDFMMIKKV